MVERRNWLYKLGFSARELHGDRNGCEWLFVRRDHDGGQSGAFLVDYFANEQLVPRAARDRDGSACDWRNFRLVERTNWADDHVHAARYF